MKKKFWAIPRKRIFFPILIILFLCSAGNATSVTNQFYVKIDNYDISDPLAIDSYLGPEVGEVFVGSVSYDDTKIPQTGTYVIGHIFGPEPSGPTSNELHDWTIAFGGVTSYGWSLDLVESVAKLLFTDGRLSGIDSVWHADLDDALEDEGFLGSDFISTGHFYYPIPDYPSDAGIAEFSINGTTYFSIPESTAILLLGFGLVGLSTIRKKFRKK